LFFQGREANEPETLYVAIEDSSGQIAVVTHPDAEAIQATDWQQWTIPASEFAGVDLASVETIYIGLGSRDNPTPGASGLIFLDDIAFGNPAVQ
jgi:hypothetical protein